MAGTRISEHSLQRRDERGMPPFVLRKIAYWSSRPRTGDGYYKAGRYGTAVVRDGTITTVLAEDMSHPDDLPTFDMSEFR